MPPLRFAGRSARPAALRPSGAAQAPAAGRTSLESNDMHPADAFPAITLTASDHSRLSNLVTTVADTAPDVYSYLTEELDRATVVAPDQMAASIVTMNAKVTFRDETTGQTRCVTLVYPQEADLADGKVSILTPVGAALIGVAEGQSIRWFTRQGEARTLTVLRVGR